MKPRYNNVNLFINEEKDDKIETQNKDIIKYSLHDIQNIMSDYAKCYSKSSNNVYGYFSSLYNHKKFVLQSLQDSNNTSVKSEAYTKRLQGTIVKNCLINNVDLIGIYPLKLSPDFSSTLFVVWKYSDLIYTDLESKTTPAVKISLDDIYYQVSNHYTTSLNTSQKKYPSTVYTADKFVELYLKDNITSEERIKKSLESIKSLEIIDELKLQNIFLAKIRNNYLQKTFRDALIKKHNCKCALCNIDNKELLVASHIIPVHKILSLEIPNSQKALKIIDPLNGLLLCSSHDSLFDKHLISFDENGDIYISPKIDLDIYLDLNINKEKKIMPELYNKEYMKIHYNESKKQ